MEKCFICFDDLDKSTIYLPLVDDYFGDEFTIFKNTFILKSINDFSFLYLCICNKCIHNYLKIYHQMYNYIRKRELWLCKL